MSCESSIPHTSKSKYSKYIEANIPSLHLDNFDIKAKIPGKKRKKKFITSQM